MQVNAGTDWRNAASGPELEANWKCSHTASFAPSRVSPAYIP
jgi:hypothetical protein